MVELENKEVDLHEGEGEDEQNSKDESSPASNDLITPASNDLNKGNLKVSKWLIVSVGVIVVAAGIGYASYKLYLNNKFNQIVQNADQAYTLKNYKIAIDDYTLALKYKDDLRIQSQLKQSQLLLDSNNNFLKAKQEYQNGQFEDAYADFQKVVPKDKDNYQQAQELGLKSRDIVLTNKLVNDLKTWGKDEDDFGSAINTAAQDSNTIKDKFFNDSSFQSSLSTFNNDFNEGFRSSLNQLSKDADQINTDGQLISNKEIKDVVNDLDTAINQFENDANEMSDAVSNEINVINIAYKNYINDNYQYFSIQSYTDKWNYDISDIETQKTKIRNSLDKLKAYTASKSFSE